MVWRLSGVTVSRGEFALGPVNLTISAGERVAVVGRNGSGKSTLLKLLAGDLLADEGLIYRAPGVSCVPQDQHNAFEAPGSWTPRQAVEAVAPRAGPLAVQALIQMGLSQDQALHGRLGDLSPGLRARVSLARVGAAGVNCVLLDEPTNHIDFATAEAIEGALGCFEGTLIVVSHDRRFLEAVRVSRIVELEDGRVIADHPIATTRLA